MTKKAKEVAARYNKQLTLWDLDEIDPIYRNDAFMHNKSLVVTADNELQLMEWELIPFWLKPKNDSNEEIQRIVKEANKIRSGNFNARAETIFERVSYRAPIKTRRCIIPSTGWFEWHYLNAKDKEGYFIHPVIDDFFSMAAIYDEWNNPETGEIVYSYSIITTEANPLVYKIHNGGKNPHRQPLILLPEDEQKWIQPDLTKEQIQALFTPTPEKLMDAYKVGDFKKFDAFDKEVMGKVG